jgi:hypothetical protein
METDMPTDEGHTFGEEIIAWIELFEALESGPAGMTCLGKFE